MRNVLALSLLISMFSVSVSAQNPQTFSIRGFANTGVGAQFYLDFAPALTGPVPTALPDPGDILVIIPPFFAKLTPNQAAQNLVQLFNKAFGRNTLPGGSKNYSCSLPPTVQSGGKGYTATFVFESPVPLVDVLTSLSDLATPNQSLIGGQSLSSNPTITDNQIAINASNPQGLNTILLVNGLDSRRDPFQTIELPLPLMLDLTFDSGANVNQPYTLFRGDTFVPGAISTFLGDTIDVFDSTKAGMPLPATIVVDGICVDPAVFNTGASGVATLSVSLSPIGMADRAALQAAITDPTATPFNIDLTAAADLQFADGKEMALPIGQDGSVEVPFVTGSTFDFYGTTYTSVFVHENGFLTFGQATTLPNGGKLIDPLSALALEPAIFGMHGDWDGNLIMGTGSRILYREIGGVVRISWGTPGAPINHEGNFDSGSFEVALALQSSQQTASQMGTTTPGNIFLSYNQLIQEAGPADFDNVIGIHPGGSLSPTANSLDFSEIFNATNTFGAILSQDAVAPALSQLAIRGVPATTTTPAYANGRALANREFVFGTPGTPAVGYILRGTRAKPDGILSVIPNTVSLGSLPVDISVVGYFANLDPVGGVMPTAFIQPSPAFSIQIPIVGVQDPQNLANPLLPGFRLNEGLTVTIPTPLAIAPGTLCDISVMFGDGTTYTIQGAVTIVP